MIIVARAIARTVVGAVLTLFQPLLYWALLTLVPSCLLPVSPLPMQWKPLTPQNHLPVPVDSIAPKIKAAGQLTAVSVLKVSIAMGGAIHTTTVISAGLSAGIGIVATGANLGLREKGRAGHPARTTSRSSSSSSLGPRFTTGFGLSRPIDIYRTVQIMPL